MKVTINWERAYRLLDRLLADYRENRFPYDRAILPQDPQNMPKALKWQTRDHALFLFHSCYYMRGGIKSFLAFRLLSNLYDQYPNVFRPEWIRDAVDDLGFDQVVFGLFWALKIHGLAYAAKENARFWVLNALKLNEYWDNDPQQLFVFGVNPDFELLTARVANKKSKDKHTGFLGFQEKMASMLAYFFYDAELIDHHRWPAPIDFHLMRVMTATEMMVVEGDRSENRFNGDYTAAARELTLQYAIDRDVPMTVVANLLWLLSSEICGQNPGNSVTRGEYKARATVLQAKKVVWRQAEIQAFDRSCRNCPLRDECRWNVPAGPYYVTGRLLVTGRRAEPRYRAPTDPNQCDLFFSSI